MRSRTSVSCAVFLTSLFIGVSRSPDASVRADEGRSTAGAPVPAAPGGAIPPPASVVAPPDGGSGIVVSPPRAVPAARPPRRDRSLRLATAVFHPRVARLARQLDEARDIADAAAAARQLLRLDSEVARDVVASYAARTPLRAFDRKYRVLVLLDGEGGFSGATANPPITIDGPRPPGTPPELERQLKEESLKLADQFKWKQRMSPPIPWSAAYRLPDGAVTADEGGGRDSVSFLFVPRDGKSYFSLTYTFRGPDPGQSSIRDVKDAQLRRWKTSAWWPKEWL